jgi:peptidyl-prolyl cis-trans isomerase A (cyclophilin A)
MPGSRKLLQTPANRWPRVQVKAWSAVGAVCALALAMAGCHKASPKHSAVSEAVSAGPPSLNRPASLNLTAPGVYEAQFSTTKGTFVVEVHRDWAPLGADRFYNLVKFGYYNGASFFRVVPGFVIQFGLNPNPQLSQIWSQAMIPDDPVRESNSVGTLAFAAAGPNTRTTQVFINLAENTNLDSMGFAPFGKVVQGMSVVHQIYGGYGDAPPGGNGPDQNRIMTEGSAYLEKFFPKLDSIKTAEILTANQPAPRAAAGSSKVPPAAAGKREP